MHTKQFFEMFGLGHSFYTAALRNYLRTVKTRVPYLRIADEKWHTLLIVGHSVPRTWTS